MLGTGSGDASWDYLASVSYISAQLFGLFVVYIGNLIHAVVTDLRTAFTALSEIIIHENSTPSYTTTNI
jgi:hypothetical protein